MTLIANNGGAHGVAYRAAAAGCSIFPREQARTPGIGVGLVAEFFAKRPVPVDDALGASLWRHAAGDEQQAYG